MDILYKVNIQIYICNFIFKCNINIYFKILITCKNKVINIPTIHKGYKFNIGELRAMLDEGLIKPTSVSKVNLTSKATGNPTASLKTQYKTMGKKAGERSKNLKVSKWR